MNKNIIENKGNLVYLPISELYPHPDNPRKELGDLSELAESIKAKGIMQNLTVVKRENESGYTIVIGHRRHGAAKLAGLKELPCVIVEMSPQDQVATMLLENMQRNDLTVYEQAQGFQMMLDFGDTIDSISEKSGFSKTTIRRRIKLNELDQERLKKVSSSRQLSIMDFDKLNEIKDVEERNRVLEYVGTNNFDNQYRRAMDEQKKREKTEKAIALLEACKNVHKLEDTEDVWQNYDRKFYSYSMDDVEAQIEKLDKSIEYYYHISWGSLYIYTKKIKPSPAEEKAKKEREENISALGNELAEITKRAHQMRSDFIKKFPKTEIKKRLKDILFILAIGLYEKCNELDYDGFDEMFGTSEELGNAQEFFENNPEKTLLGIAYHVLGDGNYQTYYDRWYKHEENEALDIVYEMISKLGYEMSDEEKQLQNGTHPLFEKIAKLTEKE